MAPVSGRTTGLPQSSKTAPASPADTESLPRAHLKNQVPLSPRFAGRALSQQPGSPGAGGSSPGARPSPPVSFPIGKSAFGGCRRPAGAGARERGLPRGDPLTAAEQHMGPGAAPGLLPSRGAGAGRGPGPARRAEGSGALAGGGCGAAVEGGNGVGGFASVRELRAGEGGRDGGTDGRREPAERHRPAALARRPCPSPHGAVPGARAALGMGAAAPARPGRRRAQPRHPAPAVLPAGLPQQVSTALPGSAAGPAGTSRARRAAEPGVPDRHCPSPPGIGAPT